MAFTWKKPKDIFKGEGIYHLTLAVNGRVPLLGKLAPLPEGCNHIAKTEATDLGRAILATFNALKNDYPQMDILAKELMPDHLHVVIWMHEGWDGSVKMLARSYSQGCSKIARRLVAKGIIPASLPPVVKEPSPSTVKKSAVSQQTSAVSQQPSAVSLSAQSNCATNNDSRTPPDPYDCGNGAHTLFSTPFIRTLVRKGQLDTMIKYVHNNPDNAWRRRLHPDLYIIRRRQEHGGLLFDTMGKARLLDYPDRQVIALSRSLTKEQIEEEVQKALFCAEKGVVTYTAAINEGEKAVAKAIRTAGYPLVIMMLNGFPAEGTEAARYFHPSGVYHKACGDGLLYLMAPNATNYEDTKVITLTEQELKRKAEAKHQQYFPLPHTSTRWRMIAGNVMLRIIAGYE